MAAAVEAAESTQEAGQEAGLEAEPEAELEAEEAEYSVVRTKEGAICKKDPIDTSMQVSVTVALGPITTHELPDSSI